MSASIPPVDRAQGIHDHHSKKLGLRKRTEDKPALKLSSFLRPVPGHPIVINHLVPPATGTGGLDFGLYHNDTHGVCGPTVVANSRRLVTRWLNGQEQRPSQEDVYDLYRQSGNPKFNPDTDDDDNGVSMQVMLDAVHKTGIGGVKSIAYAKVDLAQLEEVRAAIAIFGCVYYGVTLEIAQQTQHGMWSYKPSNVWGGHAVLGGAYDRRSFYGDLQVISWAERYTMSRTFVAHQLDEAWVNVWPEQLQNKQFLANIDMNALKQAYQQITGRALP